MKKIATHLLEWCPYLETMVPTHRDLPVNNASPCPTHDQLDRLGAPSASSPPSHLSLPAFLAATADIRLSFERLRFLHDVLDNEVHPALLAALQEGWNSALFKCGWFFTSPPANPQTGCLQISLWTQSVVERPSDVTDSTISAFLAFPWDRFLTLCLASAFHLES